MAKRNHRRHMRNVKDQGGCMRGLISMFDFRHGRYTTKLLLDRKWKRQSKGAECSQNELTPSHFLQCQDSEGDEERTAYIDNGGTSVKKLMEEDMFNQLGLQTPMNTSQEAVNTRENSCSRLATCKSVDDNDIYNLYLSKSLGDETKKLENYDPQLVLQELRQILEKSCSGVLHLKNIYDMQSDQTLKIDKERLTVFIKVLIDQFRDDGQFFQSSVFMEALQKLGSQRDLFLKLLQDPNFLMVNRIEGSEEAIVEKDPSFTASKTDEVINNKPRKFFRRRSKSQGSLPYPGDENCRSSSKIVILKPGSGQEALQEPDTTVSKSGGERHHFSFSEIKRKLKHAIRKERQVISTDGFRKQENQKQIGGENSDWCFSPNRNHFFNERYITPCIGMKKKETLGKPNQTKSSTAISDTLEPRVSDIYVKAKKNILEMIEDGDNDAHKITGELPKPLGTVLSLPEFDFSSMERDVVSASDKARPSYSTDSQCVDKSSDCIDEEDIECQPSPSRQHSRSSSYLHCDTSGEADESILSDPDQGNAEIREIDDDSVCGEDNANMEPNYASEGCMQLSVDNEVFSSPSESPSHSCAPSKVENLEGFPDRTERPSPVSVLDQSFSEDDIISPARTISWPVDMNIQPREIVFSDERPSNDQETCIRISSEDNETAFEYIEAVLLGSGLNWDEYLLRWLSSDTILDPSLYDEVELFSSKPQHEQRMLFDCTNEVLEEVCDRYFGSFRGNSCTRRDLLAVPKGMDLILEIWEGVKWHLHRYPQSQSLDQLIKKDMARSRAWMDLRLDSEHIGLEIEKAIFDNLVDDLVWSYTNAVSESDFVAFSEGLTEIESTTDVISV